MQVKCSRRPRVSFNILILGIPRHCVASRCYTKAKLIVNPKSDMVNGNQLSDVLDMAHQRVR